MNSGLRRLPVGGRPAVEIGDGFDNGPSEIRVVVRSTGPVGRAACDGHREPVRVRANSFAIHRDQHRAACCVDRIQQLGQIDERDLDLRYRSDLRDRRVVVSIR
jgi:hypothetical protein